MAKLAKKEINKRVESMYVSELDGLTLAEMKEVVEQYILRHGENAKLDYDYDDHELGIYVKRLETDKEYQTRIDRMTARKLQDLDRDRREYARLKKMFDE